MGTLALPENPIRAEHTRWREIIVAAGLKLD